MCAVCEQFDYYIDRLNVAADMSVTFSGEEAQALREILQDQKESYVDGSVERSFQD